MCNRTKGTRHRTGINYSNDRDMKVLCKFCRTGRPVKQSHRALNQDQVRLPSRLEQAPADLHLVDERVAVELDKMLLGADPVAGIDLMVQTGMGEPILITAMIVIVIGGIGSVRGAFYSAIIVGLIDTAGRAFLPMMLREFLDRSTAQAAGPALASMLTCIFMATVLALKPAGLFPVKNQ